MKRIFIIILKSLGWIIGVIVILLLLIIGAIQLPSVQTWLVGKVTSYVSGKTHTRVEIQRLGISFPKTIVLEGLFAEDLQHDTLISLGSLKVDVDMLALLNNEVNINSLELQDVNAVITRSLPDSSFNFDFIINAFASGDTTKTQEPEDTTLSPWKISVESISLERVRFAFRDDVGGTSLKTDLGSLELSMDKMDLASMMFHIDELSLKNAKGSFEITAIVPEVIDTSASGPLPDISMNKLLINNVNFGFHNIPDSSFFDFILGNMSMKPKTFDLNKQIVDLTSLVMEQCDIAIAMKKGKPEKELKPDTTTSENNWQAHVSELKMNGNRFRFNITDAPVAKRGIDYQHLDASNITLDLRNASYSPVLMKGDVKHLSLNERCGLSLKKLRTRFVYDDKHAELANLFVSTPNTTISNYISASYPSIESIGKNPGELGVKASMKNTKVYLEDVLYFVPDLARQAPFSHPHQHIAIDGKITGKLKDLLLEKIVVQAGTKTAVAMDGRIKGLPDAAHAYYDIDLKTLTTTESDLKWLLPDSTLPPSIRIPQQLLVKGSFKGTFDNMEAYLMLQSSEGQVEVVGALKTINKIPYYEADLKTKELDIGYILKQQPMLGKVSLSLDVSGHSFDTASIMAQLKGKIESAYINSYRYTNIPITASADSGRYTANLSVNDTNIVMNLDAKVSMKNGEEYIKVLLNLEGADLYALHLSKSDLKVAGGMRADIKSFSFDNMEGYLGIGNVILVKNRQKYVIDSLVAVTMNKKRNSTLTVNNSIVQVNYQGATGLHEVAGVLKDHFYQYTGRKVVRTDTITQNFTCAISIKPNRIFGEILIPELRQFSGLDINSSFNGPENQFSLEAKSDLIVYGDNKLQNFSANIKSNDKELRYDVSLAALTSGSINLPKTTLEGNVSNNNLFFSLKVNHPDTGVRLAVAGNVDMQKENVTRIRFAEGRMVLNNETWTIPAGNQVSIYKDGLNVQQFELTNNKQLIRAQSSSTLPGAPIAITFKSFELGSLSQIVEKKNKPLVRGLLDGDVNIKSMKPFAFTSDLDITNVSYTSIPVGDLKVKADNLTASRYTASVTLSGNDNRLSVNGYYQNNDIHFKIDAEQLNLATFDAFTAGQLKQSSGYITGNISIDGKASAPAFTGSLTFKDAQTRVSMINSRLTMKDETIRIDQKGIYFKKFTVLDSMGQPLVINGDIKTSNFVNMDFNLDIRTQKFRVLNTTRRNNKLYYGTLLLNSRIKVRGNELLPVINANVSLIEGSEFTFVVQEGELSTSRGEEVVIFVDTSSNTILSRQDSGLVIASQFKGIDFTANIEVNKDTRFRIIVDKNSGDKLEVRGDAILSFGIDPSGKMSLTGTYTLSEGSYRASYYVEKNFIIKPGSSITWTGDPLDGQIDITAIYRKAAPAADLLSVELSGMSPNERNAYRKPLTFEVNLIIQGSISKPQPSFLLDMAEKDRNAFGGMVYSKIGQVNANPNELNKQVFALLILDHFLPQSGLGGGGGDPTTSIARNSVNQLLSDQLNSLSGKYIKGAELNFNLQSNDNYTTSGAVEQNTQLQVMLKKELFNNRVTVQVGSSVNIQGQQAIAQQNAQNLTGDVIIEYKITEDGRYRFKAFRENNYEGIIDGLLYKTGIGVLYTRDYNKFKELLSAPKKEEEETDEEKEKRREERRERREKKKEEEEKKSEPQPAKKEEKPD